MPLSGRIKRRLKHVVGSEGFVTGQAALKVYECDGYTLERARPELVLLPDSTQQVSRVLAILAQADLPFVPRGAGTGVSGGCLPLEIPVMIGTSRMKRVRSIDVENRTVEVEAGVVNLEVSRQVSAHGLYYAPDPSSQSACTIGGNIAENSGGPHTLKYGVTVNHLLAIEMVLANGEVVNLTRPAAAASAGGATGTGYDLAGLATGSEGTFGIITAATLRLLVKPEGVSTLLAVFPSVVEASRAVSAIIAAGIIPAALEMMDAMVIEAVEEAYHFGFPREAGAVLIIELDGLKAGLDEAGDRIIEACHRAGASQVRRMADEKERQLLWKSRKRAFGAMGRLAPSYCTQDGVVPRSRMADIVEKIAQVADKYSLKIATLAHAGDGNIHPLVLYDDKNDEEIKRVLAAGREILEACLELGGSVTGEHGIGIEKIDLMPAAFSNEAIEAMADVKAAFNPDGRCNPGKVFPDNRVCVEVTRPRPRGGG